MKTPAFTKTLPLKNTVILAAVFAASAAHAQLWTKTGTDSTWSSVYASYLAAVPAGSAWAGPVSGSTINVANTAVETSTYSQRSIETGLRMHVPVNTSSSNMTAWKRWYQTDGYTQVFRMFVNDVNTVGNPPRFSVRSEAFAPSKAWNYTDNMIYQWTGRYTLAKFQSGTGYALFQSKNDVDDWSVQINLSGTGDVIINERRETDLTVFSAVPQGKAFDLKVEDDGLNYDVYIDGVLRASGAFSRPTSVTKFRWGMYFGATNLASGTDVMTFVSGARITSRTGRLR